MDMNNILQIFKTVVDYFNLVEGQNRGLHLNYHIVMSWPNFRLLTKISFYLVKL